MSSEALHESRDALPLELLDMHRALRSLVEELDAVDWYAQRVAACAEEELREVLAHNRDEEKEHACMTLEWIRRNDPRFDELLRRILFREGSIADADGDPEARTTPTLGIASLRAESPS